MNQIDIKSGVLLTVLACKSSQQCSPSDLVGFVSSLSFLLYVWGDVASSTCCCWVVGRYTGIPYIDSCPVPARHGCVLVVPAHPDFPEMTHKIAMKKRAGQPALASSSAAWPGTEAPKSPKWSPHPPLAQSGASDLESEAEVRFFRGRPLVHLLHGVEHVPKGGGGGLSPDWFEGGEGVPTNPSNHLVLRRGQRMQIVHHLHVKNRRPWISLHVVSGPWTSIVAALDKGWSNIAVCRRYSY